jgi:putative transposase
MNEAATIGFRRRHLPHWTVAGRSYFVTIRLKDSLPDHVINALRAEREAFLKQSQDPEALHAFEFARFVKVETILDAASYGPTSLGVAPVADLVAKAFVWLETSKGWIIHALTIMPNHVHVLLQNTRGENDQLSHHLGTLKGYTAREANRLLNRQGAFWMDENFDHWCRSEGELTGYAEYIRQNPARAGLVSVPEDWPWTRCRPYARSGRNA